MHCKLIICIRKKEGYTFNGWGTSGCINGNKGTYSVNSNTILYACFSSTGIGYNDVITSNPDTEEDVEPIIINYYTITYPENSRYCWNYKEGVHDGAFHIHQGIDGTIYGQNNQYYAGYGKSDSWMSDNTCFIASPCQNNSDWKDASSCTIKWQSILFDSYDATYDERIGDGK